MAQADDNLIDVRDMQFGYGERAILSSVNVQIKRGSVVSIMGPSGCGKTTFMRLVSGQVRPQKGSVVVDGVSVPDLSRKELLNLRKRMGVLLQSGALLTDLDVFENVAFPLREHTQLSEALIRKVVLLKLQAVGLRGARHLMPSDLSGGMARRVALARAVVLDPVLVLYDEPFSGLDPIGKGIAAKLIREMNDALGLTSVLISHDVAETCEISDYIYLLGDGTVMGHGTPEELLASEKPLIKQFMNALPDGPVPFHYPAKPYIEDLLEAV